MRISKTNVTPFSDFICPAILLLIAIAIAYPRWRAGIDWRDEDLLAYGARPMALPDVPHGTERLSLSRGGIFIAQANVVGQFVRQIRELAPPSNSILTLPYQPMFYFLCDRHNPTRWNYLWPGDQTTNDHGQFIKQAERGPPAIVLLSDQGQLPEFAPVIMEYMRMHYLFTNQLGYIAIYERLETR